MFSKCPKQWQLQYRDGHMENTSNVHTVFGTAVHETLQHWCDVGFSQSVGKANKINLLEYFWHCFFKNAKSNAIFYSYLLKNSIYYSTANCQPHTVL